MLRHRSVESLVSFSLGCLTAKGDESVKRLLLLLAFVEDLAVPHCSRFCDACWSWRLTVIVVFTLGLYGGEILGAHGYR